MEDVLKVEKVRENNSFPGSMVVDKIPTGKELILDLIYLVPDLSEVKMKSSVGGVEMFFVVEKIINGDFRLMYWTKNEGEKILGNVNMEVIIEIFLTMITKINSLNLGRIDRIVFEASDEYQKVKNEGWDKVSEKDWRKELLIKKKVQKARFRIFTSSINKYANNKLMPLAINNEKCTATYILI